MKKILILIMIAVMMFGSSCSNITQTDPEPGTINHIEENDHIKNVLSDWFDYLYVNEYLHGDMFWAITYIEQFFDNPTWDNLQIARTALITAEKYIEARNIDEPLMSNEDYIQMLQAGYDVAVVEVSGESYAQYKQKVLTDCIVLKNGLYDEIFWEVTFEDFQASVELLKEYYCKQIQYLNTTTEYLLLNLNDSAWTDKFHAFVEENCPTLNAFSLEPIPDMDSAYTVAVGILDDIQKLTDEFNLHVGEAQAALYQMEDAIFGGDMTILQDKTVEIADMPLALPYPGWDIVDNTVYYYSYTDESGKGHYPVEQETLSKKPDGCTIEFYKVSKDDFETYKNYLSDLGVNSINAKEEDGISRADYIFTGHTFVFEWKEDTLTLYMLEQPIIFVPWWYLSGK